MKKILNVLIILVMLFSLSVTAFAGNLSTPPDIYASEDKIANAPEITDVDSYILFWDNVYNCYIRFIFSEGQTFTSDGRTLERLSSSGSSISIVNNLYQNNTWGSNRMDVSYNASWLELVGYSEDAVFTVNGELVTVPKITLDSIKVTKKPNKVEYVVGDTFSYVGLEVTAYYSDGTTSIVTDDCTVIAPDMTVPSGANGRAFVDVTYNGLSTSFGITIYSSYDEKNDESNMTIIDKITAIPEIIVDMVKDTFNSIIDFFKFLVDITIETGTLFSRLPELVTNLTGLFDTLDNTLMLIWNNSNGKAIVIVTLAFVSFFIAVVNVFLRLFAGSKLGGGA